MPANKKGNNGRHRAAWPLVSGDTENRLEFAVAGAGGASEAKPSEKHSGGQGCRRLSRVAAAGQRGRMVGIFGRRTSASRVPPRHLGRRSKTEREIEYPKRPWRSLAGRQGATARVTMGDRIERRECALDWRPPVIRVGG